jgi:hypothetical protein
MTAVSSPLIVESKDIKSSLLKGAYTSRCEIGFREVTIDRNSLFQRFLSGAGPAGFEGVQVGREAALTRCSQNSVTLFRYSFLEPKSLRAFACLFVSYAREPCRMLGHSD